MEFCEKESACIYLSNLTLLENMKSCKQEIVIYEHPFLGLVLVINGEIQHIEKYQCPYHETLVHLPASFIKEPHKALIIGGGSLFAAYEVLKYPSITHVVLCDHDKTVLNLMEKYYPHAKAVKNDNRFEFVEMDGVEYIQNCQNKFDLIINDCFNLLNITLEKRIPIYLRLKNLLTPTGVCSDIIYRHIFDREITQNSIKEIKKYSQVVLSLINIPEYPGVLHIETIWGNSPYLSQNCACVINEFQKKLIKEENFPFNYFFPSNLSFYLYLPPYIREIITI